MGESPTISTHVLDADLGKPAPGIIVTLYRLDDGESLVSSGMTDDDGRIRSLLDGPLVAGRYRLAFELDGAFFGEASVTFVVIDTSRSYHVPMLVAPYSLTTYRGS